MIIELVLLSPFQRDRRSNERNELSSYSELSRLVWINYWFYTILFGQGYKEIISNFKPQYLGQLKNYESCCMHRRGTQTSCFILHVNITKVSTYQFRLLHYCLPVVRYDGCDRYGLWSNLIENKFIQPQYSSSLPTKYFFNKGHISHLQKVRFAVRFGLRLETVTK